MRREIPLAITFISGFLLIVALFIPHKPFGTLQETFNDWYIIVSGFTMILGIDSLLLHNWNKVKRKKSDWPYALTLIMSFFLTLLWGLYSIVYEPTHNPFAPTASFLKYFYNSIFVPLQATMFALLAFFIASAAYRAFRAREINSTLLLFSAALVMLGRVPEGEKAAPYVFGIIFLLFAIYFFIEASLLTAGFLKYLYIAVGVLLLVAIYPVSKLLLAYLPKIADWIMNIPQLAAKRGILIGVALGGIAMSLRIIVGIERTYLK